MITELRETTPIKLGKMPKPRFFNVANPKTGKDLKLIGIVGYSVDCEPKTFIWRTNIGRRIDEGEDLDRRQAASYVARWKIFLNIDTAIGPAINIRESKKATGEVSISTNQTLGLYVDAKKYFDLPEGELRIPKLKDLRKKDKRKGTNESENILHQALSVLPRLP